MPAMGKAGSGRQTAQGRLLGLWVAGPVGWTIPVVTAMVGGLLTTMQGATDGGRGDPAASRRCWRLVLLAVNWIGQQYWWWVGPPCWQGRQGRQHVLDGSNSPTTGLGAAATGARCGAVRPVVQCPDMEVEVTGCWHGGVVCSGGTPVAGGWTVGWFAEDGTKW